MVLKLLGLSSTLGAPALVPPSSPELLALAGAARWVWVRSGLGVPAFCCAVVAGGVGCRHRSARTAALAANRSPRYVFRSASCAVAGTCPLVSVMRFKAQGKWIWVAGGSGVAAVASAWGRSASMVDNCPPFWTCTCWRTLSVLWSCCHGTGGASRKCCTSACHS